MHIRLLCIEVLFCISCLFPQAILQFFVFFTAQVCFLLVNGKSAVIFDFNNMAFFCSLRQFCNFNCKKLLVFVLTNSIPLRAKRNFR